MTTTFPPSEIKVRRSLIAFQIMESVSIIIIMILLVISLSMGYAICTKKSEKKLERQCLMNQSCDSRSTFLNNQFNLQQTSNL